MAILANNSLDLHPTGTFFFVGGRISGMMMSFGKRNLLDFQLTSVPECIKHECSTVQFQYTPIENSDFR